MHDDAMPDDLLRRPIRTRGTRWAAAIAGRLAAMGVRPNTISIFSMVFAAAAGGCLIATSLIESSVGQAALFVSAAVGIQLRLLCNLFDGMVAIEEGRKTASGAIYNELPDRFADAFILVGAGYSSPSIPWMDALGWSAAVLAAITAYVRALGASVGGGQHFIGPMAKPQRMAVMTIACLGAAVLAGIGRNAFVMGVALAIVAAGCLATIVRRCGRIIRELEA